MIKRIGIVGSEAAKFTPETEQHARDLIQHLIDPYDQVVSGGCHLGGIDIWAVEEAQRMNKSVLVYYPKTKSWTGGYKDRNLLIAEMSDRIVCITIREYPSTYHGMKFDYCYHCKTNDHIKSGGCWTVKQALGMGKKDSEVIVI